MRETKDPVLVIVALVTVALPAMDAIGQKEAKTMAARPSGTGKCVLTIGGKTVKQEKLAADDLRAHIRQLTDGDVPIVAEGELGDRVPIVVGRAAAALKKLGVRTDFDKLGLEGIVVKTRGPALILAGNRRGVLYAVYTFLEDYCNCRWFAPDCTVIPKAGRFDVADLDVRYIPPLEYRSTDYPRSRPAMWAVRNKVNGTQGRSPTRTSSTRSTASSTRPRSSRSIPSTSR